MLVKKMISTCFLNQSDMSFEIEVNSYNQVNENIVKKKKKLMRHKNYYHYQK